MADAGSLRRQDDDPSYFPCHILTRKSGKIKMMRSRERAVLLETDMVEFKRKFTWRALKAIMAFANANDGSRTWESRITARW